LELQEVAFVRPPNNTEGARTRVKRCDLLLTITGANVGKAAQVDVELEEAYVSQHVALIRPIDHALTAYLHLFLTASTGGRGHLDREAYGAGKPGLNLQQVGAVIIPLPSNEEILALMQAVSIQLEAAKAQKVAIELSLEQATAQRKNLLKAAFSGQLVPQDPDDEPASELLARIRAERETRVSGSTTRRPRRTSHA
jgi:type I restriction enzyme S subunit